MSAASEPEVIPMATADEWLAWLRQPRTEGPAPVALADCADALEAEINRLRAKLARIKAQRFEQVLRQP